jgi:Arc/MetJ family transcription regulator
MVGAESKTRKLYLSPCPQLISVTNITIRSLSAHNFGSTRPRFTVTIGVLRLLAALVAQDDKRGGRALRMTIEAGAGLGNDRSTMVSYTHDEYEIYTSEGRLMTVTLTSIRLDINLADEAAKVLGVKSRTEAVHVALREIVALKRFKDLMRKHRGKLSFAGHDE